jgi:glycosyltransferase involved in cell wall biosynthesis
MLENHRQRGSDAMMQVGLHQRHEMNSNNFGVNVSGFLSSQGGHASLSRGYAACLKSLNIPLALNDWSTATKSHPADAGLGQYSRSNPYPINLVGSNVDWLYEFAVEAGSEYFKNKYNIGIWSWELPAFPERWYSRFNLVDEIWVASSFEKDSIAEFSPVPVYRIEPVIEIQIINSYEKSFFGLPIDEYTFLFAFDCLSSIERKNPLAAINAFRQAFSNTDKVRLVLKCVNGERTPEEVQVIQDACGDARITLMNRHLDRDQMLGLMNACDCYVSLHRSEGFGLTLAESMAMGKPVIATGWSGNVDFMTDSNSYPTKYHLDTLLEDSGPWQKGNTWARADIDDAARLMREVYENQARARAKGEQAQVDIAKSYSLQAVARLISDRLSQIKSSLDISQDEEALAASRRRKDWASLEYHHRIDRYWTCQRQPNRLKQITPERILRRLLRPMLNQLGDYHEANFRVISELRSEIDKLKTQVAARDKQIDKLLEQTESRKSPQ